jgi:hypothetical protein
MAADVNILAGVNYKKTNADQEAVGARAPSGAKVGLVIEAPTIPAAVRGANVKNIITKYTQGLDNAQKSNLGIAIGVNRFYWKNGAANKQADTEQAIREEIAAAPDLNVDAMPWVHIFGMTWRLANNVGPSQANIPYGNLRHAIASHETTADFIDKLKTKTVKGQAPVSRPVYHRLADPDLETTDILNVARYNAEQNLLAKTKPTLATGGYNLTLGLDNIAEIKDGDLTDFTKKVKADINKQPNGAKTKAAYKNRFTACIDVINTWEHNVREAIFQKAKAAIYYSEPSTYYSGYTADNGNPAPVEDLVLEGLQNENTRDNGGALEGRGLSTEFFSRNKKQPGQAAAQLEVIYDRTLAVDTDGSRFIRQGEPMYLAIHNDIVQRNETVPNFEDALDGIPQSHFNVGTVTTQLEKTVQYAAKIAPPDKLVKNITDAINATKTNAATAIKAKAETAFVIQNEQYV